MKGCPECWPLLNTPWMKTARSRSQFHPYSTSNCAIALCSTESVIWWPILHSVFLLQIKKFDGLELALFQEGVLGHREYRKWLQGTSDKLLPSPSVVARKRKRSHAS